MKKAISKLPATEAVVPAVYSTQTVIQPSSIHPHNKTACRNLTATGYCTVCKRQCPPATINASFNQ